MVQKPFSRSVLEVGSKSLGISLPRSTLRQFDVDTGDELPIDVNHSEGVVEIRLDNN
jgi:antitoxin component of MazEF toxin-antitoxin module